MDNTPAEIYANVLRRALLEAEREAIAYAKRCSENGWGAGVMAGKDIAGYIRSLIAKESE